MLASEKVTHRTSCRLCSSGELEIVVPYPATPIADAYVSASQCSEVQELYPLDLYQCRDCGHVQLCDVVNPDILFSEYTYETSVSLGLVEHFKQYAADMMSYSSPPDNGLVVEIGSNDGSLLEFFQQQGLKVLGVDPAKKIAIKACDRGVETIADFFTSQMAEEIKKQHGSAHIIAANNVFAHADDMADIANGIELLLDKEGLFSFEVSYLPDIIERNLFDTIYHEHLCYHTVEPLQRFFKEHGLEFIDFLRIPTKGGSFRGIVGRIDGSRKVMPSIAEQISFERQAGYGQSKIYQQFSSRLAGVKRELHQLLGDLKQQGKVIAGYGASATVTTLLYYFGIGEYLDFIVDDNPKKFNTYSPGYHIPVWPSQALYDKNPDFVIVLAWNYAKPIMVKHQKYVESGGTFIIPLPTLKVLDSVASM